MYLVIIINPKFAASTKNEFWNTVNGHTDKLKQDIFKQARVSVEVYRRFDIKLSKGKIKYFIISFINNKLLITKINLIQYESFISELG